MAKTWREKFETPNKPVIKTAEFAFADIAEGQRFVISTPAEIASELRKIRRGSHISIHDLRNRIAQKHGVDATCPLTTGIFLRVVSEMTLEDMREGRGRITAPFWRAVSIKSSLATKLSCGLVELRNLRMAEGIDD